MANRQQAGKRPFLGVMFDCCKVYTRLYLHRNGLLYEGRCPRCRKQVRFVVGQGGSETRIWRVR